MTTEKKNKGKKIHLETADRLFREFMERVHAANEVQDYALRIAGVCIFGSYLRREERVGDIDLSLLALEKGNREARLKELSKTESWGNIVEHLYLPDTEVYRFLKQRNGWFSLHSVDHLLDLKAEYKIHWIDPEFVKLADLYERSSPDDSELRHYFNVIKAENYASHQRESAKAKASKARATAPLS